MKEKFIKPQINVLLSVVIGDVEGKPEEEGAYVIGNSGEINISLVEGDGGENWD